MTNTLRNILAFSLFFHASAWGLDDSQRYLLPSMGKEYKERTLQPNQKKSFNILGSGINNKKKSSSKNNIINFGNHVIFSNEKKLNMVKYDKFKTFQEVYNRGKEAFSFVYIKDDYNVSSERDIFDRTFINNVGSKRGGSLHFSFDYSLYRKWVNITYGGSLGVGYNNGNGIFVGGNQSVNTKFQLWTLPLDFNLMIELPIDRFFNIQIGGGPSLMGLLQSRSDMENWEKFKHRRQVSYGYTGQGRLKISLGNIFYKNVSNMIHSYGINNFYLNLEARYQNYSHFQNDDISILGTSFGVGFSFDYL